MQMSSKILHRKVMRSLHRGRFVLPPTIEIVKTGVKTADAHHSANAIIAKCDYLDNM